jgi:para-aminobenzoate synthetase component I
MNHQQASTLMNQLGQQRVPFLFIIDFKGQAPMVMPLTDIDNQHLKYSINGCGNAPLNKTETAAQDIVFKKHPIGFEVFETRFNMVMGHLKKGNSYLVNLTCPTPIETNLSLEQIFNLSRAPYRLWLNGKMVVFSPETFVKIQGNRIYSFPMKGTINAALPNAHETILTDFKEMAEHATITDLIRNDLSLVANHVKVDKYRYVDTIKTHQGELLQVSSQISGELLPNWPEQVGDILFALLPAGSISGAPKAMTVNIINQAEQYQRGFYTGIFGLFDGHSLDSGVMIRFIEQTPQGLIFKSGGGITVYSNARDEYNEMIEKVYLPF